MCGLTYGPEYPDTFCTCGFELVAEQGSPAAEVKQLPAAASVDRPPPGTPCLVLYGPDRQPLRYFPLQRDSTVVGRVDAVEAAFPEIDLAEWLDAATARRVSRKHVMILRSRQDGSFSLRPLPGNTGTQLESDMVAALQDYPLQPGNRLILGGAARLKFEITCSGRILLLCVFHAFLPTDPIVPAGSRSRT
jgi:hypothetical protein